MRVILDTNVFVSGVFFTGPPYQILKAWRDGKLISDPQKETGSWGDWASSGIPVNKALNCW